MPRLFTWHSFVVGAEGSGFKYRVGDDILIERLCSSHSILGNAAVVPQIRARPLLYTIFNLLFPDYRNICHCVV